MSVRVYEIAKKFSIANKDLVAMLQKEGFPVASHMSVLDEKDAAKVERLLSKPSTVEKKETKKEDTQKKPSKVIASAEVNREVPKKIMQKHTEPTSQNKPVVSTFDVEKQKPVQATSAQETSKIAAKPALQPVYRKPEHKGPAPVKRYHSNPYRGNNSNADRPGDLPEEELPLLAGETSLSSLAAIQGSVKGGLSVIKAALQPKRKRSSKRSIYKKNRKKPEEIAKIVTDITINDAMPLYEAADLMGKSSGELVLALLRKGTVANRNQMLSVDVIRDLAVQFGLISHQPQQAEKENNDAAAFAHLEKLEKEGELRWPMVVVMGHVDHGKTTLLDYIRKMNVAAKEKGGITQHLSAYEAETKNGKIIFLDTPGHEAFSYLRRRGASVTDIAVLVVAADDGVMPQTIEAIKYAREAEVPIIVAINKVDKVGDEAIERIKTQLARQDLTPEDWGGTTIAVPISAKTGKGIDKLLEMILLQGQMMDLKSLRHEPGKAFVLESHVEKGYGTVASIIGKEGTIRVGDYFACGENTGRIRLLIDSYGKNLKEVGPAIPVKIVGFNDSADMGDWLRVVSHKEYLDVRAGKGMVKSQLVQQAQDAAANTPQLGEEKDKRFINIVLKTDTRGSREAISSLIDKLLKEKRDIGCPISIISSGIGDISEGDIDLAINANALLIGFNVKTERNAQLAAKDKDVDIKLYQIIYTIVEDLTALLEKKRVKKSLWKKTGEAEIRKVFDIKGSGVIAGCYMRDGVCSRQNKVVCVRNGKKIGDPVAMTSLQRDRKSVKEVHSGYEFAFVTDAFQDWQIEDVAEFMTEYKE